MDNLENSKGMKKNPLLKNFFEIAELKKEIERLKNYISELEKKQQIFPVTEKPKNASDVLVFAEESKQAIVGYYRKDLDMWLDSIDDKHRWCSGVTHWSYLPEFLKKEKDE